MCLRHFSTPCRHARHHTGETRDLDARLALHQPGAGTRSLEVGHPLIALDRMRLGTGSTRARTGRVDPPRSAEPPGDVAGYLADFARDGLY